ncbi:sensor histidine kinase [Sporosarcina sp. Te-1]|uniref:sensor histidine kinase n=1 Tax=Sporosarcina sp. Te-1 TaxID=2818390 RepID=UPI001A9DC836|nr:GHKL domain-containing protein [Sporosarcina sp. Te-1]QTD42963.1 GHKL domain-containing protein [Sporosarcina sp. Te-1]
MLFIIFSLLNYFILYGSLFYVLSLRVTGTRFLASFFVNAVVACLAYYLSGYLWVSIFSGILLSGGLFYLFSRKTSALLHSVVIPIFSLLAEYTSALIVQQFDLPLYIHGCLIVLQLAIFVALYKRVINNYQDAIRSSTLSKAVLLLIAGLTFIVFYSLVFIPSEQGEFNLSIFNLSLLFFYFLIMAALSGILLYTMTKENKLAEKKIEQQQFSHYIQALEQVNREMQSFHHDYANILLSLRGYIETEDWDGLKTFFEKQILQVEEQTLTRNRIFHQLDRLSIPEIKGLLATKLMKADELSIPVNIEISDKIDAITLNVIDLTRILGIFMDNAIEASALVTEPQINLAFISTEHQVIIVLENKIEDSELSVAALFEDHYSTKGQNRGVGLPTAKKILSDYPHVTFNSHVENGWFIHIVIIKRC